MKLCLIQFQNYQLIETVGDGAEINDVVNKRDEYKEYTVL